MGKCGKVSSCQRLTSTFGFALSLLAASAAAQPALAPGAVPDNVELDVLSTDAGYQVTPMGATGASDGGLSPVLLLPPKLLRASPAQLPGAQAGSGPFGTVELLLLIDEEGAVKAIEVSRPLAPGPDASAVLAAKGLRFEPALLGGRPVAVRMRYAYVFVAPRPASSSVVGQVRARGTREPVAGAVVLDGKRVVLATSDGAGRFELRLEAGEHPLLVEAPGFRPATLPLVLNVV